MKKYLLLLASVALLLVGCAKENFVEQQEGELVTATFTASLDNGVATKALADGDGAAASVNRCIMEIYYGDDFYARKYAKVTDKKTTFTAQVVSNRKYTVAFWADKVDDAENEAGLAADKYYTTTSLKEITIKGSYIGNDDARDAFFFVDEYTVAQAGSSFGGGEEDKILLKRPFAQMNVITTDWDKAKKVTGLAPEKVKVTLKKALDKFNAVTGVASGSSNLEYEATVYTADAHGAEKTLSMDYLFAPKTDKAYIDIDWKALHTGDEAVAHSFAAVPYQRNYRTNIKGNLLTTTGNWTVTVEPQWSTPDYDVPFFAASSITDAQNYIAPTTEGTQTTKVVDLSKATIKTTDITGEDNKIEFRLKTTSPIDMVNFTLPAIPVEVIEAGCTGWKITHDPNYPTENVNVNAPAGTSVVIDAPISHVTLNGELYEQVTATTGPNTLVVPEGVTVKNLIVKQGAVEIHGTVENLTVTPGQGEKVVFRACEGLSAAVFAKIYKESEGVDFIDRMYTYELVGEKYNIYKLPVVAMIDDVEYPSIASALAAVKANETIEILSDIALDGPINISNSDITIEGNNHTIAVSDDEYWNQYKIGGEQQGLGKVNMISVEGSNVTLKNVTLDGKDCRGVSLCTTSGGKNVLYQNIIYTGRGCGHYYGEATGLVTFDGCKFDIHGYAVHFGGESSIEDDVVIKNCELNGWNSFGACKSLTITNSHLGGANDEGKNGWFAVLRPYCPATITNCTFSDMYIEEYPKDGYYLVGLGTGASTTVVLNGCKIVNDSKQEIDGADIYSIVRKDAFADDAAYDGSVFAFDATGNATDGYTAGTFYAKNPDNIKAAPSYEVKAVEGKENIYTVSVIPVAKIGDTGYETLQAAFNAVPDGTETTITLYADATTATLGDKNNIGAKTVILNLNGHSITGHMRGVSALTSYQSLDGATLVNYANLTINGEGTIGDLEGEYHHNALVNMSDGTNLTINGGTFVAKSCCVYHYSASSEANTASINVNGGTFKEDLDGPTNKYVFGIGGKSCQTLTFNYKEATSEGAKGIYCSLAGTTINIHSGSITADISAINLSGGNNVTINIDGGKLKTLDSENHENNYKTTGSYTTSLPIYASGGSNIVCNISGGEFIYPYYSWQQSGTIPATWERVINAGVGLPSNVANANITASLTGGTYSTNQMLSDITNEQSTASGIVAEGYTCKKNDDGTWTVVKAN